LSESFRLGRSSTKNCEHLTAPLHHLNRPMVMAQHAVIIAENAFHPAHPATPRLRHRHFCAIDLSGL
jgi:hypothetical protein